MSLPGKRAQIQGTSITGERVSASDFGGRAVIVYFWSSVAKASVDLIPQITKLQNELDGWLERVPPIIVRFRTRNKEAEQLEKELAAAQERIAALESMLSSESTRVEPVDPDALGDDLYASNDADESNDELIDDSAEDFEYLSEVEEVDEIVAEEVLSNEVGNDARDNLKRIKGIGPAIEKTLHELGIFRFDQIADMSEYDIDRVAKRLKGFRSRIYREDWIGQSRDLLSQNLSGSA